jgi:hypothetical protein
VLTIRCKWYQVLVLALLSGACGGNSSPTQPTTTASLSGIWSGSATDSSGPGLMTWQITQTGSSFAGTMTMTDSRTGVRGTGSVSGTVNGATIQFSLTVPSGGFDSAYGACTANVSGQAAVSGTTLSGSYAGTNSCSGTISSGNVTLTKAG